MENRQRLTAVCGLDCGSCDIRKAPTDSQAAQRILTWFREMGWLSENEGISEVIQRSMYCTGCRGDRSVHWSPDCWILKCCVDEKGLGFCHECEVFPCEQLNKWSMEKAQYAQALERLQQMSVDASA